MPQTLAQKLKIKEDYVLRTRNAPAYFAASLAPLPEGVHISLGANRFDQLHWFVNTRAELEAQLAEVLPLISGDVLCWVYYPKGSSGIQTDLTRDKGWEALLAQDLERLLLISFNDTWSAFAFRSKSEGGKSRSARFTERPILAYIDAENRKVRPPEDLAAAFAADEAAAQLYAALSFSNQKEYVEWIVTAVKPETRQKRVEETLERLHRGWKNPRNV